MDENKVREAICILKDFDRQVCVKSNGTYQTNAGQKACELAIEALEKQLPKKADIMDYLLDDINFRCPVCKSEYICEKEHEHFYCPTCGQKLDWSEEHE